MHLNLDPTVPKVAFIAILLFAEGIVLPSYTVINQGRWPTMLEMAGFILSATMQLITFLLVFVRTGQAPETTETPPAPTS